MSAAQVFRMAQANGIRFRIAGSDLVLEAEREPPSELLDAIRREKAGLGDAPGRAHQEVARIVPVDKRLALRVLPIPGHLSCRELSAEISRHVNLPVRTLALPCSTAGSRLWFAQSAK